LSKTARLVGTPKGMMATETARCLQLPKVAAEWVEVKICEV